MAQSRSMSSGTKSNVLLKNGFLKYFLNNYDYYIMLLPAAAFYIIFRYLPLNGILMAFEDYNFVKGVFNSPWVGLEVFREVFREVAFWKALFNTIWLNSLSLIVQFPLPIIFALMLNELKDGRFKKFVQTTSYLPHFISWIVIYGLVLAFVDKQTGVINILFGRLGLQQTEFLTQKGWWVFIYVFAGVWKEMGWTAIIYLAAMGSIDSSLYEAANIDGANRLRRIWHVTLPGIRGTIVIMLILSISSIVSIGFDQPFLFGNPLVNNISSVLSTFIYTRGIVQYQYSYTTAVGLFQQIINFMLLATANKIANLLGEEGIMGGYRKL